MKKQLIDLRRRQNLQKSFLFNKIRSNLAISYFNTSKDP